MMGITSLVGIHSLVESRERTRRKKGGRSGGREGSRWGLDPALCHAGVRSEARPESGSSDKPPSQAEESTAHLGLHHLKRACWDLVSQGSLPRKGKTWGTRGAGGRQS